MMNITAKTDRLIHYTIQAYRKQLQDQLRLAWNLGDQEAAHKISKLLCEVMVEHFKHSRQGRK
jgi:hypothetical protein